MEIINLTPFQCAYLGGKVLFPENTLTLIVKGTFDLAPGGVAAPAEEQLYPTGDLFYPDDEKMQGGPRYSSDFAYFKPRADLFCVGKCHAPAGTQVLGRQVTFSVGNRSKQLKVIGDRHFKHTLLGSTATNAEPFSEMEMSYQNSYGGEGYLKNPAGKGFASIRTAAGEKLRPLPNITRPQDQQSSPNTELEPAGFGPLGGMWPQRASKLGTYKGKYMKERWPWFAKDFDWHYFNSAPEDLQIEGYLKGDETLFFENLNPTHPHYRSQLPGVNVKCFLSKADTEQTGAEHFQEVTMRLDTLWADMEEEKVVLVWRGVATILTDEYSEIEHLFIAQEETGQPAQEKEAYHELFLRALEEEEAEWDFDAEEGGDNSALTKEFDTSDDATVDQVGRDAEAKLKNTLVEAGHDPDQLPPPDQSDAEAEKKIIPLEEKEDAHRITREMFIEKAALKESFANEDLSGIDISELTLTGLDFQGAILTGGNLCKSDLSGADLTGANLTGANLADAVLSNATLVDADLTGCNLTRGNLAGAILDNALFDQAGMQGVNLDQVSAQDTSFVEANLTGASLQQGNFGGADFSNGTLDRANFRKSNLKEAFVEGAVGIEIDMSQTDLSELRASEQCNFTRGIFKKAMGLESIWEDAILDGADFSYALMEGADFSGASLKGADLSCADMKFARFEKADLSAAKLIRMNLFQGSLEKANLSRTDLSGANLYEVEFLSSVINETRFESTNLKKTKLAKEPEKWINP